ncbi:winged helix-turn-helix domain-containing protein [Natronococcus occultus]|uniref:Transcriptional regulator n=1 Tax=Natronococcus occultus SP4 TaxID=694430 RepID=L0JV12_9EURY|nr:helix-turn-helix domain-containing protein [Natronococcus occultus]AGB36837.1 transcriptional regulator [Natronococcus occultus SP4]
MSATNSTTDSASPLSTETNADTGTVLAALEDGDCRAILEATADEALTAAELASRCEIPSSTVYRKLELLTDAGLLEERIRIQMGGKHASEYCQCFDEISISVSDIDGVSIDASGAGSSALSD